MGDQDHYARDTIDKPDSPRLNENPCSFCGRSTPHEHTLEELEAAERYERERTYRVLR